MSTRKRHFKRVRHPLNMRYFRCTVCGADTPAPNHRRITAPGHIKTMWCYKCKAVTDHYQVREGEDFTLEESDNGRNPDANNTDNS